MSCCCPHSVSGSKLFSFFAKSYQKRFHKKGFEPNQIQLISALERVGFSDQSILEVGCGVGYLHQSLILSGARSAVGIDLSDEMIRIARDEAAKKGIADRTAYHAADVVEQSASFGMFDLCVLDKVVCCYPDHKRLLDVCLQHTVQSIALTYPKDRWYTRLLFSFGAVLFRLAGSNFRPYVHSPSDIEQQISAAGFEKVSEAKSAIWLTQAYVAKSN